MPVIIDNNYDRVSLSGLRSLCEQGYSVVKSPHVGNQHPSNLLCAALGIPLHMVSFTRGLRDRNFHPHVRIEEGSQTELCDARTWTPFAKTADGMSVTDYHQQSVRRVFPGTTITTDMELMRQYPCLSATVLGATNIKRAQSVWYRKVSDLGMVTNRSKGKLNQAELETDVFGFSNQQSGWIVPNKVHMIFDFVYQSLSSGRSVIYHLSGPQMVEYIDTLWGELSVLYDAVRQRIPALPLTLTVRVVPVSAARLMTTMSRAESLGSLQVVHSDRDAGTLRSGQLESFVRAFPEFTTSIETGTTLSQYDLGSASDLKIDPWVLSAPLRDVSQFYNQLLQAAANNRIAAE